MVKMYLVNFLLMTFVGTKSSHGIFDVAQSYTIVFLAIIWVRVSTISLTTQCVSLVVDTLVCQAQLQGLKTKETYVNLSVDRTTSLPPETRLMLLSSVHAQYTCNMYTRWFQFGRGKYKISKAPG